MDNVFSKEQQELMAIFERTMKKHIGRTDKEAKVYWSRGIIYQDGQTNLLFLAFRSGYALRASMENE